MGMPALVEPARRPPPRRVLGMPIFTEKGRNMPAEVGDVAPEFTLTSVNEGDISLSQYRGQKSVVLSFHVFDFTSA